MPTLFDLRSRYSAESTSATRAHVDESLVVDALGHLRPAQVVEEKLNSVLRLTARHTPSNLNAGRMPARHG